MAKNDKFDWSQVPSDPETGFVDYYQIKSHTVRMMLMEQEYKRLSAEFEARQRWTVKGNAERISLLDTRLDYLRRHAGSNIFNAAVAETATGADGQYLTTPPHRN